MSGLIRTTITLSEQLFQQARYYAVSQKITVSQLMREGLKIRIQKKQPIVDSSKKSFLELAGSLDLKGKAPPIRSELYEKHIKHKMGS